MRSVAFSVLMGVAPSWSFSIFSRAAVFDLSSFSTLPRVPGGDPDVLFEMNLARQSRGFLLEFGDLIGEFLSTLFEFGKELSERDEGDCRALVAHLATDFLEVLLAAC